MVFGPSRGNSKPALRFSTRSEQVPSAITLPSVSRWNSAALFHREPDGTVIADGTCSLRVLNRKAGFDFPLEGPKTINGLLLEELEDIPEAGTTLMIADQAVEILQVQNRMVKVVRIAPRARAAEESKEAA